MMMNDKHVNMAGFLEGSPDCRFKWRVVDLISPPSEGEWRSIECFQVRAREFLHNVEDLHLPRILSLGMDNSGTRTTASSNTFPGRHRTKSLYVDFRHFIANDEPSNFHRVTNVLRKNLPREHSIQAFLSQLKGGFLDDGEFSISVSERSVSLLRLINLWFNTEVFHSGNEEQLIERQEWLRFLQDDAVHHILAWGVVNASHRVKLLYACSKDLDRNGMFQVNCPDEKIIFKNK